MSKLPVRLFLAAVALVAGSVTQAVPASAAQPAAGGCYFMPNYIEAETISWSNGGSGIGCYSIDASGRIFQSTYGNPYSLSEIPGGGNADYFYYRYWENANDRRICVIKSGRFYYDTYVLGTGWHGWTPTSSPASACPDSSY